MIFNKHILSIYYTSVTVLSTQNVSMNKREQDSFPTEAYIRKRQTTNHKNNVWDKMANAVEKWKDK